jgi:DNA-binding transcriptional LysR family regulator
LLLDQQADLVITSESAPRPGVAYVPLFWFEMLALLPPGHPLAAKKWLTPTTSPITRSLPIRCEGRANDWSCEYSGRGQAKGHRRLWPMSRPSEP